MGLSPDILAGIEVRLHEHAGFDLPKWVVESRAQSRMSAMNLGEKAYLELVNSQEGEGELAALVEAVRVGETRFFRHKPHVDAVLEVVIPDWRGKDQKNPRVWSAGCATGEEAYTLALVLSTCLPKGTVPNILATDVSAEALAMAQRGIYPESAVATVPERFRDGLLFEGGTVRVRSEIGGLVRFRQHNLADSELPRPSDAGVPSRAGRGFDLVWCRNVLIYFAPEPRKRVLERLVSALSPGGFLFLGYSETLRNVAGLQAVRFADQILWQKVNTSLERTPGASAKSSAALSSGSSTAGADAPRRKLPSLPLLSGSSAPTSVPSRRPSNRPLPASGIAKATPERPQISTLRTPSQTHRAKASPQFATRRVPSVAPSEGAAAHLRPTDFEPNALAAQIRASLRGSGLTNLTLDLDGADYLGDEVAAVFKRAIASAEAAGIGLVLRATRPGPQRWLRRNGFLMGDK